MRSLFFTVLAFVLALVAMSACTDHKTSTLPPGVLKKLPLLGKLPHFELTSQTGEPFGTGQLLGNVWVANFIFTRCRATCPAQTRNLATLQNDLEESPYWKDVRLVSFSVDPASDRPEVLQKYALEYGADEKHWQFLTGTRDAIWQLSKKGFRLAVGENPADSEMPLFHSPKFVLVDRSGNVRGYFDGASVEGLDELKRSLKAIFKEPVALPWPGTILKPRLLESCKEA